MMALMASQEALANRLMSATVVSSYQGRARALGTVWSLELSIRRHAGSLGCPIEQETGCRQSCYSSHCSGRDWGPR